MPTLHHPELVGLLAQRGEHLALRVAPVAAWRPLYRDLLLPVELPGHSCRIDEDPQVAAMSLCQAVFGVTPDPLPGRWMYGPSARHAVDRAAADDDAAPFLRFERMLPGDVSTGEPPRLLAIAVYRARLPAAPPVDPSVAAGVLWTTISGLRALAAGVRVSEALARDDLDWQPAPGVHLPADGLLFLPSELGERHLIRIAAKYGEHALYATR